MLLYFGSITILPIAHMFVCDVAHTRSIGAYWAGVANLAVRSSTGRESEKARK
jgi:hypothetical protein